MENGYKLEIQGVSKVFLTADGYKVAIDGVSLRVRENEFVVLLGPGECGKSVLLNVIAGLTEATCGEIFIDGRPSGGINPAVGMVFQELGIMPWLTVRDNVAMPEKLRGVAKRERHAHVQQYIDLVGLRGFERYYPNQLSGGMKQRVGIARAYAGDCDILLMDEPFGKLDAQTRYSMQDEILKIWNRNRKTVIFVTNNIEEAVYLGDRIVLFTASPMKVRREYDLRDLTRPRNYTDERFLRIRSEINRHMDLVVK